MKIIKCHITNFGCYSDKAFEFDSKLNPFLLNNGEGKTTLATFIKAMFYSLEKSSTKSYERKHFKPYSGGEYGGSIDIELDGTLYRIERVFGDSPVKDVLVIYDGNAVLQTEFLGKKISLLQGEASAQLGELIFGVDAASFQRCHFISSNDLDFVSNESIKNKIGNIVIDRDKENSFERTYELITSFDLRDKAPTASKNENAYPYRIKELQNGIKRKKTEIENLDKLELSLKELYEQREKIKEEILEIEKEQKAQSFQHIQLGKMSTVNQYNHDIDMQEKTINDVLLKYDNNIPQKEEIDALNDFIKKYEEYLTINNAFKITTSDVEKLKEIEAHRVTEDDYSIMYEANSKLLNNISNDIQIDFDEYNVLKEKFDSKNLKSEEELEQDYIDYRTLKSKENDENNNIDGILKDFPSENVLSHINNEIEEYNNLSKKIEDYKASYKEVSLIVKILLTIITLGIYLIILNNKKKEYVNKLNSMNESLNNKAKELDSFFNKYDKDIGKYDLRMAELKDDILKYENSKDKNEERVKKHDVLMNEISNKENDLLNYFALFNYVEKDVDETYRTYKNDLKTYNNLNDVVKRNEKVNKEIEENKSVQLNKIDDILTKYNLFRKENFTVQLSEIKENIDFYNKYHQIYVDKLDNEKEMTKYKDNIIAILNNHNINYEGDFIIPAKGIITDVKNYDNAKLTKSNLIEKKDNFIKENHLEGFKAEVVEQKEEELRKAHETKKKEFDDKENEISQIEFDVSRRDKLNEEISEDLEKIKEYEEKVTIATLAAKALEEAQKEMEAKFISPIKDSFITYAKKIYEKMATNVSMNYDYEISYEINGKLREIRDLSDGERTIMMLSLRFAILDSMYKNHDSLIILDDPFESLDEEKLSKVKEVVKSLSNEWQILYFTCHKSRKIEND